MEFISPGSEVASTTELEQLPEDERCVLNVLYGMCDLLFKEQQTAFDGAEHLFYEHQMVAAGYFIRGMLQFVVDASRFEARLFHEHGITGGHRFDVAINVKALQDFDEDLHKANVAAAQEESRHGVKH